MSEDRAARPDFPWDLLLRVSRSFFLTLRMLPAAVREPVSLAYLLARLSDTEADGAATKAEHELLRRREEVLGLLPNASMRAEIEAVWKTIREGQRFDLERFRPAPREPLDAVELDRYTHLVAGCVGEFWTRVCFAALPGFSSMSEGAMRPLAVRFGKGLQMVNILRDRHADAARGRIYVTPEGFDGAVEIARGHLAAARMYCHAIRRPWRLRAACLLPCLLAGETLELVCRDPAHPHAKISRTRVRILFARAVAGAMITGLHQR
jgi:farnesyl-diphosphate farnesyltransferase